MKNIKKIARSAPKKALRTAGAGKRPKAVKPKYKMGLFSPCGVDGCTMCGARLRAAKLGSYHGYDATLVAGKRPKSATLRVGCRSFRSPAAAQRHWRGGLNPNGQPRPRAAELIDKARNVAKALRWKWGGTNPQAAAVAKPRKLRA